MNTITYCGDLYNYGDEASLNTNRYTKKYVVMYLQYDNRDCRHRPVAKLQTDDFLAANEMLIRQKGESSLKILKKKGYDAGYYPLNGWHLARERKLHGLENER